MSGEPMRRVQYTGDVWDGAAVHPDLWRLLLQKHTLIELTSGDPPYAVVLGVPHHAAPGVDRIADDWLHPRRGTYGRAADETTGLTGLAVFHALIRKGISCKLIIAAHAADHDPNKTPGSPYWESVFAKPDPGMLFELHGAGKQRKHALELSAGRNPIGNPKVFGKVLAFFFHGDILACQSIPGFADGLLYHNERSTSGRLENPALETHSLTHAGELGIPALHLETKFIYRQPDPAFPDSPRPTLAAWQLAHALAETIALLARPEDISISAAVLGLPGTTFLTRPALEYQDSYLEAVRETPAYEMDENPELRVWTPDQFTELVKNTRQVNYLSLPEHPPEEFLWLIDQGEFIGRVFFLHWLNAFRRETDGQIDYWIRPSRRRQGYGRLLLRLLLERYQQLGAQRVLISCLTTNLPSQKIIEANGGVLEGEVDVPDFSGIPQSKRRFWIDLNGGSS